MTTAHSALSSGAHLVDGFYEVASHHVGKTLIAIIRDNLFTVGKIRRAEYYMDRSRALLQHHFVHLPVDDQETIRDRVLLTTEVKERLEGNKDTGFRKYLLARDYKRESKSTFKIIQTASQRTVDVNLMDQILEAVGGGAPPPPTGSTTVPRTSNPFIDSHAVSTLTRTNVHNLESLELETYRSQNTGETAIVVGLHDRDGTTQEVAGTIPLPVGSGDTRDEKVETATVSASSLYGPPSEAGGDVGQCTELAAGRA